MHHGLRYRRSLEFWNSDVMHMSRSLQELAGILDEMHGLKYKPELTKKEKRRLGQLNRRHTELTTSTPTVIETAPMEVAILIFREQGSTCTWYEGSTCILYAGNICIWCKGST